MTKTDALVGDSASDSSMNTKSRLWRHMKKLVQYPAVLQKKATARYAKWDTILDTKEREFCEAVSSGTLLNCPFDTSLRLEGEDFRRWSASTDRDLMLWLIDGEVWIVGDRASACHELAFTAFELLEEGLNKLVALDVPPLDELDGHLRNGQSFLEASMGGYHRNWRPRIWGKNPPILIHSFDSWASFAFMGIVMDKFIHMPGVHLCIGVKAEKGNTAKCIAVARWRDPDHEGGIIEDNIDGLRKTLEIPVKACFEGKKHMMPSELQAFSERNVTISLSWLAFKYSKILRQQEAAGKQCS
ncbi:hypothetical protein KFL_003500130 [Klebsormidium nitens]|uniref:Uncharacterized protein n=1 Tax=Klebsormidium nitens TaxID=105231 RepID=A0A1Y1IE67_KLENI|nr:hypothetical protein KFL_003500130 [Klebsormidium nitens]|eukprot:GAQ87401.1 hypothetical protein KFL_003500130 [Klebsormidium nitens]